MAAKGIAIEFLVNNAGFGTYGLFAKSDLAAELSMIQVNISAPMSLTRLFLPAMVEKKRGRILNVGSMAGFVPGPYMASNYVTKAFVLLFSLAPQAEVAEYGVTVTDLCPGPTETEFTRRGDQGRGECGGEHDGFDDGGEGGI